MSQEPKTIEEYQALLEKLREVAGPRNDRATSPSYMCHLKNSNALQDIRKLLHLPRYGFPIQRWESDADGNLYLD